MLTGKSNKIHSSSESQTKTTQQQYQQPDLQQLSLVIEQFSSQLNLMLSQQQQQQQKHSDTGITGDTVDNKQEQPIHSRQQQQVHCPVNASRFPPSHSNCCNNIVGSYPKNGNQPHCHSQHSTFLSPSLSSFLPSQQHHYTSPCMHGQLHQNYHQHPQLVTYGYDAVPPPSCMLPMMCCCQTNAYQCPTTTNNTIFPPTNDTMSPCITTDATPSDHRQNPKHRDSNMSIPTPTAIPNSLDSCADATTCPSPTTHRRFKSRTDPLPPIPNDDSPSDDDDDNDNDDTGDDHKATMVNGENNPLTPSLSSSPSHAAAAAAATVTASNCDVSSRNTQVQHDGQISWTDIYRQDILAKRDTLASSYNDTSSSVFNNDINSNKEREYKSKSSRSPIRGWWSHGKYKWKQLRKKSVSPLSVPG